MNGVHKMTWSAFTAFLMLISVVHLTLDGINGK
jgi:hypothetical protein